MVAYSFKPLFVAAIRAGLGLIDMGKDHQGREIPCELVLDDGETKPRSFDPERDLDPPITPKRQTIRTIRTGKNQHASPGEELQLYTGMRTKYCKLIGKARCVSVEPILIDFDYRYIPNWPAGRIEFGEPRHIDHGREHLGHVCQGQENLDNFARADGFANWIMMKTFWEEEHGLAPFRGVLIKWEPLP